MPVKTTTLVKVLRNHGVEAWVDINGDIEATNTFIDENGLQSQEVVTILPTIQAVTDFLGFEVPDEVAF